MDGGRTLLVTTRHGQTHRSGFLAVDTETGETRLLREEDKRYGNIFNPPFLPPAGRTIDFTAESSQSPDEVWIAVGELDHARRLSELTTQLGIDTLVKSRVLVSLSRGGVGQQEDPV